MRSSRFDIDGMPPPGAIDGADGARNVAPAGCVADGARPATAGAAVGFAAGGGDAVVVGAGVADGAGAFVIMELPPA